MTPFTRKLTLTALCAAALLYIAAVVLFVSSVD